MWTVVNAHLDSLSDLTQTDTPESPMILSEWSSFCVAQGMYLTSVLGVWNQGSPLESRLFCHILRILKRDVQTNKANRLKQGNKARDLWAWKAFLGAFSLGHAGPKACDEELRDLKVEFVGYVSEWSKVTGITQWSHAREVLTGIVWPTYFKREDLAMELWEEALQCQFGS